MHKNEADPLRTTYLFLDDSLKGQSEVISNLPLDYVIVLHNCTITHKHQNKGDNRSGAQLYLIIHTHQI